MVLAAEGRKANDSHADCYQYFCVPEYGTANGRLHFHAVHFMRTLPTGSVDPNFGRRVRNRRQLNSLQNTWPYGYSMPIAVRYTQDAFSRSGWLWPVDAKGEPLKATSYMAVGFYVAKYVNKKSDMDLAAKGLGAKEWNNSLKTKLSRSEERFSRNAETDLVCRLLLEKKNYCLCSTTFFRKGFFFLFRYFLVILFLLSLLFYVLSRPLHSFSLFPYTTLFRSLKATSYMAVGFYVAKYVNKKSDMDLAAKGLGAKEWNNSLKTKLSLLPKKLFRIRMSRNFGMKMHTMTNLSTECLIQLTKLGYDATPFNQILKQNAKREMRLRLGKVTVADVLAAQPVTTNLLKFMRASVKMIGVSNLQSFIASMTQKLTLSDISDESKNYLDKAGITTACLRIKSKWTAGGK